MVQRILEEQHHFDDGVGSRHRRYRDDNDLVKGYTACALVSPSTVIATSIDFYGYVLCRPKYRYLNKSSTYSYGKVRFYLHPE